MKEKFSVTGMTCSACSAGIERTLNRQKGVERCEVSLMGECMSVTYDETQITRQEIIRQVQSLGYGAYEYDEKAVEDKNVQAKKLKRRFLLSLLFLMPLMYFSMGGMIGLPQPSYAVNSVLQAIFAAVIIGLNYPFFTSGVRALFKKVANMDTLVAMGSAVSYGYSAVLTVLYFTGSNVGHAHLFYESAAMILTLVTLGKWLEEKSKRKTGEEIEKLIKLMPSTVSVEREGEEKTIQFSEIVVGDLLIVRQGDYIPVDGVIVEGHAFIDRAAITGESLPVEVGEGASVTSADVVKSGYLKVSAQKVGSDTTLSQIVKMVKEAGASKAPIQKTVDKIAGIFVPAVTLIAVFTFVIWLATGAAMGVAANYAISVLVISCPCSLGLATPVAIMAATGKGMSLGVLYKDAESLQKMRDVNCVLLDKTATLTKGKPQVTDFVLKEGEKIAALNIAYALESYSNHPIAECIKEYAEKNAILSPVSIAEYAYQMGKGGSATVDGEKYTLGNKKSVIKSLQKQAEKIEGEYASQGKTVVLLATEKSIVAVFAIADTLKETSVGTVAALQSQNIRVGMLTGDNEGVAKAIAEKVGIDDYFAEALPEDKAEAVKRVQSVGGIVAMVGDGINDSPALKQADVGVAVGTGTDIAIDSASVVLVGGDLSALPVAIDLSKKTVKNIAQNLFWAFFYNVIAIPVAAGALAFLGVALNPMIAAACMSLSSLFVVTNALRLTRFGKNYRQEKEDNQEKIQETEGAGMQKTLIIEGMMCQHCVAHVTKALQGVTGVKEVSVSLEDKRAVVVAEETIEEEVLIAAVVDAGYEVILVK